MLTSQYCKNRTDYIISTQVPLETDHSLKLKVDGKRLTQTDTAKYLGFLLVDQSL